jgi:hypothetical protein
MKKITLYFIMLLSFSAFAQVEIVENFDNAPDFGLPTDWTGTVSAGFGSFVATPGFACGGSGKTAAVALEEFDLPATGTLTTPNYSGITNDTDLTVSFSLNVYEQGPVFLFPVYYGAPIAGWGSVNFEYSTDGGANWVTAITIDDSNYTYVNYDGGCVTIPAENLGALAAGNDFQARFVVNANAVTVGSGNALIAYIDNISIAQVATDVPNCDATLISPTNGSVGTDLNDTITWQAASGIPTGYKLSIGTSSGATDILNAVPTSDTSYSLAGLGLNYSTEYFVNILPFNTFGDATTGCVEESFTTRDAPIEGATCSNPYIIDNLTPTTPYVNANDFTGNYENNINEGPCGGFSGAYIDGFDVFYEFTPTEDVSIDIQLAAVSSFGAAIHVFDSCPDVATECVAFLGHDYSTAPPYNLELNEVVLLSGNTYVIVLSSAGFDSNYDYSLIISQNTCINPSMTLAPVSDCDNNQFTIDADIASLGSASSLTLSDNFGNSIPLISSTGVVNIGPYASGVTVELTLSNEQDANCSFIASTFYYCPPTNDDCSNAIDLTSTINTDSSCSLVTSATNAGATESSNNPINCDFTGVNEVWFSFVASQPTMILEYLNITAAIGEGGTNQSTELLEGSCGTFTSLGCFTNTNYVTLNSLIVGDTYYIRNSSSIDGDFAQNYDICLKEAPAPPSNDECSNATVLTASTDETCDNVFTGTTVGATPSAENTCNDGFTQFWKDVWFQFTATEAGLYRFSFDTPNFNSSYFIYSGTCGALVEESTNCFDTNPQVQSMESGETLYVMVRTSNTEPGFEFDLCVFKLPPPVENNDCSSPTELLESTDANGNNMISGNFVNSYPSSEACDIGGNTIWYSFTPSFTGTYYFNLTPVSGFPYYSVFNTDDCASTANNYVPNSGCYGSGMLTTDLVAGSTYLISIYSFDTFSNSESFDFLVYPDASLSVETNNFETFKYYPNPVLNELNLEAKALISDVSIFNILGQKVQFLEPNSLKATLNMNELESGVYFVNVTVVGSQKTIKVVKK